MQQIKMYASCGYTGYIHGYVDAVPVYSLQEADVILFAGGADISPEIYSHRRWHGTYTSPHRDGQELLDIQYARENNVPIVGTCRGAQLLTAIAGGNLYQDIDHPGHHLVKTHDGKELYTNSLHHQMCNVDDINHELLAWTENLSNGHHLRWNEIIQNFENVENVEKEPEVFILPDIKALCIQSHPEMGMQADFKIWWDDVVRNFYSKYLN